ncbi:hypothetical protein Ddc_22640 [Ditylenchus destructor]|nr:hypothetical protein Ddc_22640 [Ditylenchus destructor]
MAPRHQPMIAGGKRDLVTIRRDANASRGDHLAIARFGVAIAAIAFILEPLVGFMGKRRGGERQKQEEDRQNKAHRHGLR